MKGRSFTLVVTERRPRICCVRTAAKAFSSVDKTNSQPCLGAGNARKIFAGTPNQVLPCAKSAGALLVAANTRGVDAAKITRLCSGVRWGVIFSLLGVLGEASISSEILWSLIRSMSSRPPPFLRSGSTHRRTGVKTKAPGLGFAPGPPSRNVCVPASARFW